MTVEFLIATINRTNLNFLERIFNRIEQKDYFVLVINQCIDIPLANIAPLSSHVRCISINERGISKSRNMAIKNAIGDICVISDDDVVFENDVIQKLEHAYLNHTNDVNIFKIITPEGKPYKNYLSADKILINNLDIMQVSSIEITFRRESIKKENILFNEKLGLGAELNGGEEICFLKDCLSHNLKIKYNTKFIVEHPKESSGKNYSDRRNALWNGAMLKKLYPYLYIVFIIYFSLKRRKYYIEKFSLFQYICLMLKGSRAL